MRARSKARRLFFCSHVGVEAPYFDSKLFFCSHVCFHWEARLKEVLEDPSTDIQNDCAALLRWCGETRRVEQGRRLHARLVQTARHKTTPLGNLLVQMYARCGCLAEAWSALADIARRDVHSWNTMIAAYARKGNRQVALEVLCRMRADGIKPNRFTFLALLSPLTPGLGTLEVKKICESASEFGFLSDIAINTALLNAYGRCGSPEDAHSVFNSAPPVARDVVSWTSIIAAYARNGRPFEALQLFEKMRAEGRFTPNRITFLSALQACADLGSLEKAKAIHDCIIGSNVELDVKIRTSLLHMYGKCGGLKEAEAVFSSIFDHDLVSWNAMISVYAQNGHGKEALELLRGMDSKGMKPDRVTFLNISDACDSKEALEDARMIHKQIISNGFESDVAIRTALVTMYGKCGSLVDAQIAFDGICRKDIVSWSAMIAAYARNRRGKEALQLLRQMELEGVKPDKVTFISILDACTSSSSSSSVPSLEIGNAIHQCIIANGLESDTATMTALLDMYGKCGSVNSALTIFEGMQERNVISWNAMIAAYTRNGLGMEAVKLFYRMERGGVKPDKVTFLTVLDACASLASLENGRAIHEHIIASGLESDMAVKNALLNMFSKCGSLREAKRLFGEMTQKNVISWTAMIAAYTRNGHAREALKLFNHMDAQGIEPDRITLLGILNTCASLTSLKNGRDIHEQVVAGGFESDSAINTTLLNMYGKCGNVRAARTLFDEMLSKDVVSWNAMIAVYAQNGLGDEVLRLFQHMSLQGVKPDRTTFLSILNACSHTGMWNEGLFCFVSMVFEHGFTPSVEHFMSVIDLLGRTGCLNEAEDVIRNMPVQLDAVTWTTFLGGFRIHGEVESGIDGTNQHVLGLT